MPSETAEEKQATLAAIVDSSDDAIISKDLNGFITSWNKGAERIFGYTEQDVVGKHITIIIPERLRSEEDYIIGNVRNGVRVEHFETIRKRKDGTEINISLTVSPIRNKDEKIIGASKIARDITRQKEIELQLQQYAEKLQELNKYKDEFMAMASHELKTPLTVIKANLQIMQHKMEGDPNAIFLNQTLNSVNKLTDLITGLLDVSKIQAGKLEMTPTVIDMSAVLKESIENIQPTAATHKIIFNEPQEKLLAKADKERIEQVIVNLLTNAVKYSPESTHVFIDAYKADGKIIVSFKDSGIGIPAEDLENIFSRFYRVRGLASTFSGSGIGLYISSEIVKRHNGEIWVESEIDKGSTFYFSIPAAEN